MWIYRLGLTRSKEYALTGRDDPFGDHSLAPSHERPDPHHVIEP